LEGATAGASQAASIAGVVVVVVVWVIVVWVVCPPPPVWFWLALPPPHAAHGRAAATTIGTRIQGYVLIEALAVPGRGVGVLNGDHRPGRAADFDG
jgi:hypothetical protein